MKHWTCQRWRRWITLLPRVYSRRRRSLGVLSFPFLGLWGKFSSFYFIFLFFTLPRPLSTAYPSNAITVRTDYRECSQLIRAPTLLRFSAASLSFSLLLFSLRWRLWNVLPSFFCIIFFLNLLYHSKKIWMSVTGTYELRKIIITANVRCNLLEVYKEDKLFGIIHRNKWLHDESFTRHLWVLISCCDFSACEVLFSYFFGAFFICWYRDGREKRDKTRRLRFVSYAEREKRNETRVWYRNVP